MAGGMGSFGASFPTSLHLAGPGSLHLQRGLQEGFVPRLGQVGPGQAGFLCPHEAGPTTL